MKFSDNLKVNNILKDVIFLKPKGVNIWIKEANFYSRNIVDLQVCLGDNTPSLNSYAKGDRLILSLKNFYPLTTGNFIKNNGVNEITVFLDMDKAKLLRDFLNKVIT